MAQEGEGGNRVHVRALGQKAWVGLHPSSALAMSVPQSLHL